MTGPFNGIKVLELGRFIAVPYCGEMLAEGGADVIKVEPLTGDQSRHNGPIIEGEARQFLNKNRGKRSIAVDLDDHEVLDAIRGLAAQSDVVLANFRPNLSQQLGLDYDTIRDLNPAVIYAENTAYGRKGPLADSPGMDIVLQGYSGLAHQTEHGPEQLVNPMIDYTTALTMAWGISSALFHRERTGEGQRLDVALLHSAMIMQNNQLTHVDAIDGWRADFLEYKREALSAGASWGEVLEQREQLQPHQVMRAYYGFFETADGMIGTACNARTLRGGMIELMGIEDRWTTEPGWLPEDAKAYAAGVRDQVVAKFKEHPTEYWIEAFSARGLPIGPARLSDELFDDPQVIENNFLGHFEHDLLGGVTVVAPPVQFERTPMEVQPSVPLGKHTREVLEEAGLAAEAVERLAERGAIRLFD